jgi:hypothetical protein
MTQPAMRWSSTPHPWLRFAGRGIGSCLHEETPSGAAIERHKELRAAWRRAVCVARFSGVKESSEVERSSTPRQINVATK